MPAKAPKPKKTVWRFREKKPPFQAAAHLVEKLNFRVVKGPQSLLNKWGPRKAAGFVGIRKSNAAGRRIAGCFRIRRF
jgi:hypothetical protein